MTPAPQLPPGPSPLALLPNAAQAQAANPGIPWYAAPGVLQQPMGGVGAFPPQQPPLASLMGSGGPSAMAMPPPPMQAPGAMQAQMANPALPWYQAPGAFQPGTGPGAPPALTQASIQAMLDQFMKAQQQPAAAPVPPSNQPNGPDG